MTTKSELIDSVGREKYEAASNEFKKIAAREDFGSKDSPAGSDIPHDLSPAIWDSDLPERTKIALFFDVFDDLAGYGMLMYAKFAYPEMSREGRELWWAEVSKRLTGESETLRQPLLYSLWCDFFESVDTVKESWAALTEPRHEKLVRAILPISGPVPWEIKRDVYEEFASKPEFCVVLLQALVASAFDYFGEIDIAGARRLLAKLDLPPTTKGYSELVSKLSAKE